MSKVTTFSFTLPKYDGRVLRESSQITNIPTRSDATHALLLVQFQNVLRTAGAATRGFDIADCVGYHLAAGRMAMPRETNPLIQFLV